MRLVINIYPLKWHLIPTWDGGGDHWIAGFLCFSLTYVKKWD